MKKLCALLAVSVLPFCVAEGTGKQGGVCFRGDDNHTPAKWNQLRAAFDKHGYKLCASLNLAQAGYDATYAAFVRELQAGGHEIMDHTLDHRVFQLRVANDAEAAALAKEPFVDHAVKRNVCFAYRVAPVRSAQRGEATVSGSRFLPADTAAFNNWRGIPHLLFEDKPDTVYLLGQTPDGTFELRTIWGERTVDLGTEHKITYRRLCKEDIRVLPDAMRLHARKVREICKARGIRPPTTWIQPGGDEPTLWADDIAAIYGREFGYTAAATYPDAAIKCFNEFDPKHDRRFAMQWGSFLEDARDLAWNKTCIADGVARHHVMVGHSHLGGPAKLGGWEGTLERTEAILAWCKEAGIPVRTMAEWADTLYSRPTDPNVNVFPDLGTDRDGNGRPDGISLGPGVTVDGTGEETRLIATRDGVVCRAEALGGVEKGANELSLELPAGAQAALQVYVGFPKVGGKGQTVPLVADPTHPGRVACTITVPDRASTVDLVLSAKGVQGAEPLQVARVSLRPPQQ